MSITRAQAEALQSLRQVWPTTNTVMIGASALGFYYEMMWRQTQDIDLVVALELDEFPGVLAEQ